MNMHFVLTAHWHSEIKSGRKTIEYRAITPYWTARLKDKPITTATFSRGYNRKGIIRRDVLKIDVGQCPYAGWDGEFYRIHIAPMKGQQ